MALQPDSQPFFQKFAPLLLAFTLGFGCSMAHAQTNPWDCQQNTKGHWTCNPQPADSAAEAPGKTPVAAEKTAAPTAAPAKVIEPAPAAPSAAIVATTAAQTPPEPVSKRQAKRQHEDAEEAQLRQQWSLLDWYPREVLTSESLTNIARHCDGAYIEPVNPSPEAGWDPELAPMRVAADQSKLTGYDQASFIGAVEISKGDMRIRADRATYHQSENYLTAEGNVELRQAGGLLKGDTARVNGSDGMGQLTNAEYIIHEPHIRGEAEVLERNSETTLRLVEGAYTRCAPNSSAWMLVANDIEIDKESGLGTARHARLRVKDVPVFYWPYVTFPIDNQRRSGFLWPTIGTAKGTNGLDLTVPIYWNIAPNWDATVAPRYIGERGLSLETEVRHLNRYSEWQVGGGYINDKVYGDKRWIAAVEEEGLLPGNWYHKIDYTRVSDNDYLNDLNVTSLDVKRQTQLLQQGSMRYQGKTVGLSIDVSQFQTINETVVSPYKRLPAIGMNFDSGKTNFGARWTVIAQATNFDVDSFDTNNDGEEDRGRGARLYVEPGVSFPMEDSWWHLTPTIKAKGVVYALDDKHFLPEEDQGARVDVQDIISGDVTQAELDARCSYNLFDSSDPGLATQRVSNRDNCESRPNTIAPMASLDAGLVFDRSTSLFGSSYTNTFEPRLYYLYTQYKEQEDQPLFDTGFYTFDYNQLFRESRFTGYDRIADANQISLGLTTRLFNDKTGVETLWASIGQIYYFNDREVILPPLGEQTIFTDGRQLVVRPEDQFTDTISDNTRGSSEIATELGYQWNRNLRSYVTALYDPKSRLLNQAGFQFRYLTDDNWIFNLAHRYRRQPNLSAVELVNDVVVSEEVITQSTNQSDLSAVVPMGRHWSLLARWNYDHTNTRSLEEVAGVEYNSCCWKARVLYQTGLDASLQKEYGIFFQLILKGLGGTGNKVRGILEDAIVGFEERENNDEY